jgi:preprotein translocase subunit YajC
VLIKSSDKAQMELKVWTKDLVKYFETGENVVVISGLHAGGSGMITAIQDKHAIVAMEGTNHELKILLSNLKIKRDDLGYVKLDDFLRKSEVQALYSAGDLILYESYRNLGLVLEVKPDILRVLTT